MRQIGLEISQKHSRTGISPDIIREGGQNRRDRRRLAKLSRTREPLRIKTPINY